MVRISEPTDARIVSVACDHARARPRRFIETCVFSP